MHLYLHTANQISHQILPCTVIPVEPQYTCSDRPWPTCALKRPALLLLSAYTWMFPGLLSLVTPAQQGEIGIWCRGTVFHYRLPPQGQEKVSLPCAHLAKWENSISVITAHTKHMSLIGSNHTAVNIDNNPEFKGLPVIRSSKGFARPKAMPQPRFSFDHSLQVAPAAEPLSGTCWKTDTGSRLWGGGWMYFPLQVSPIAYKAHLGTREHKMTQT